MWNKEARLQGQKDIPLNENGIRLARLTGEAMRDIHFDYAFSSPLNRALMTARLVLGEQKVPLVTDDRLREISFGDWEGRCVKNPEDFPAVYLETFYRDPLSCPSAPNGETFGDVVARMADFYQSLLDEQRYKDKVILISTHGAASRCLLSCFYEDKRDIWRGGIPKNCSVSIVQVQNGKGTVLEKDRLYAEL